MIYRKRWDVISGGFLAGDAPTIRRFSVFFFKTFMNLLDQGKIDDDQVKMVLCFKLIFMFRPFFSWQSKTTRVLSKS